ncbi:MGDG synthase family glycosyltransferase [Rariglobus hedericola]|uniref:UDP-N-acetylglucosamine--LPS N-acetylglucosamine transferase n=1 Tax=Rariglobus hedericola TaxID=2597822 RepID=A0A556QJ98_9BACT|nr:UDP-N-acetylglucosamine--LPS N-acetylglucosamine transferase [Rariglobus hedericola]TSJ76681.1 UDP-N-acetylglucosamine--LPS N-acetylglucosamine transferase [Rariglobus hedericola]
MRWLILTSSTGTGHNMRAESLKHWAHRVYGPSVEIRIHAALESTHGLYRFGVELYNMIQRRAPRLHHIYFNYLEIAGMHRRGTKILGRDAFTRLLKDWQPDRVISVHAHTNHGFFDLVRAAAPERRVPCITYCGELYGGYGFSRHWANPRADGFIGASSEVCAAAKAVGTPDGNVLFGGFLLRPPFYASDAEIETEANALAAELQLDRNVFTLLLSTGLAGANNHLPILRQLAASGKKLQVIALCSHNEAVRTRIEAFARRHPQLTIRALGHTQRMVGLKRLSSVLVARPGTGATSEAILLGTPLIHNGIGGVMPQELITVQYCRQHSCARFGGSAREVAREALDLLDNPSSLAALKERLRAARPPGHPEQIVRWIHDRA